MCGRVASVFAHQSAQTVSDAWCRGLEVDAHLCVLAVEKYDTRMQHDGGPLLKWHESVYVGERDAVKERFRVDGPDYELVAFDVDADVMHDTDAVEE